MDVDMREQIARLICQWGVGVYDGQGVRMTWDQVGGWHEHFYRAADHLIPLIEAHTRAAVEAERAACEAVAREQERIFGSDEYATGQPLSSFKERFACGQIADAIAARKGGAE